MRRRGGALVACFKGSCAGARGRIFAKAAEVADRGCHTQDSQATATRHWTYTAPWLERRGWRRKGCGAPAARCVQGGPRAPSSLCSLFSWAEFSARVNRPYAPSHLSIRRRMDEAKRLTTSMHKLPLYMTPATHLLITITLPAMKGFGQFDQALLQRHRFLNC